MPHTPGPWNFGKMLLGSSKDRRSGFVVNRDHDPDDAFATRICDMRCAPQKPYSECEANARLIAAAPELLEACRLLMRAEPMQQGERNGAIMGRISTAIDAARAALEKATGESR